MKLCIFLFLLASGIFLLNENADAQATAINITGSPPDANAILDIKSTTQGFLPPRLTATQRATLAAKLTTAQAGMEVADFASGKLYYWDGIQWSQPGLYTGTSPVNVSSTTTNKIALNPGTQAGDLITWDGNNWVSMQPDNAFSFTLDNRQPSMAISYCIALQGLFPSPNSSDVPFYGEIELFSFGYAPKYFALCNGQLLPINTNQALFSLLGTTYGGNGQTTFALPDLRSRVPIGFQQGTGLSFYYLGENGGIESNTLIH